MKSRRNVAVAVLLLASGFAVNDVQGQFAELKRTNLMHQSLSAAGREAIQVRVDFPPGASAPMHNHPGEELVYVIEGLLEYQFEGEPPVTLKAGDVLFIPARKMHAAKNVGAGNAAELATYIVEKGKPLTEIGN